MCQLTTLLVWGCGTGTDDIEILNVSENDTDQSRSVVTIDLSYNLLQMATTAIFEKLLSHERQRKVSLLGICCDFDDLASAKPIIQQRRRNKVGLYHLLGLTLGNYKEQQLLTNISSIMKEGDYLLVSIDVSADVPMLLKMAEDNYDSMKAKKNVDDFLLGPLNWATQFETVLTTLGKDKQKSQIEFRSLISKKGTSETIDYKDPKQFPRVWKTREKPGKLERFQRHRKYNRSFAYYVFEPEEKEITERTFKILCDYSNKYTKEGIKGFFSTIYSYGDEIALKPVNKDLFTYGQDEKNTREHDPTQALILMQKQLPSTTAEKVIAIVNSIKEFTNNNMVYNREKALEIQKYIIDGDKAIRARLAVQGTVENKKIDPREYRNYSDSEKFIKYYTNFMDTFKDIKLDK